MVITVLATSECQSATSIQCPSGLCFRLKEDGRVVPNPITSQRAAQKTANCSKELEVAEHPIVYQIVGVGIPDLRNSKYDLGASLQQHPGKVVALTYRWNAPLECTNSRITVVNKLITSLALHHSHRCPKHSPQKVRACHCLQSSEAFDTGYIAKF